MDYSTSKISWSFLFGLIQRLQNSEVEIGDMDLNFEAPSMIILCCSSIEAFCNEISSLTKVFLFRSKQFKSQQIKKENWLEIVGVDSSKLVGVKGIKESSEGSFYERYKKVLKKIGIEKPEYLPQINYLKKLRDSLVHFRACDVQIIQDDDRVIKDYEKSPKVFNHMTGKEKYKIAGFPTIAEDENTRWHLRISTNAMAIWSIRLSLKSISYILESLPAGKYRNFILKAYKHRDENFKHVFHSGLTEVDKLENNIFK